LSAAPVADNVACADNVAWLRRQTPSDSRGVFAAAAALDNAGRRGADCAAVTIVRDNGRLAVTVQERLRWHVAHSRRSPIASARWAAALLVEPTMFPDEGILPGKGIAVRITSFRNLIDRESCLTVRLSR